MKADIVLANPPGILRNGSFLIHSPSRWSEATRKEENRFAYYPFFLGYLSSLLKTKTDFSVKMMDGCLEKLPLREYLEKLLALSPRFLFMETSSLCYPENLEIARALKQNKGTQILFAGPHSSLFPDQCLKDGIDFVFRGEYEMSVLDFFINRKYRENKKIFDSLSGIPFGDYPFPEDEDVSRFDYALPGEPSSEYKEIQIYATRGCLGRCPFCVASNLYYHSPFHTSRAPLHVFNEMQYLKSKYPDLEGFFFDEEDHFGDRKFLKEFLDLLILKKNTLKIEAMGRLSSLDLHLLPLLKQAGYYKIRVGVESLDSEVQSQAGKKISPARFNQFLHEAKKAGISVYATFQVGLPGSTRQKDLLTLSLIRQYLRKGLLANVQVSVFTPFPGTPAYQLALKEGALTTSDLSKYNGGGKTIVNWNKYSKKEIDRTYQEFILGRNHDQFISRFKNGKGFSWIQDKLRKHTLPGLIRKTFQRIRGEFRYFLGTFPYSENDG